MEIIKGAKDLTRNPLGIVALFISLIYGFASLLLGISADKLHSDEKWPLLIFVVVFPFAVLFVFYKLVTEHHGKLYSPSDYKTDDSFLKTLSPEEKKKKLEIEAKEATGDVFIEKESLPKSESKTDIKSKIVQAENYVISLVEKETGIAAQKDIKIGSSASAFDAAFIKPRETATILEVKYYSRPRITARTFHEFINRAKLTSDYMSIKVSFILALVLEGNPKDYEFIVSTWADALKSSEVDIELRVFNSKDIPA